MKQFLLILVLCCPSLPVAAQDNQETSQLSPAQMQADVGQLDQAIQKNWSYLDDKVANLGLDYEGLLEQLEEAIRQPLTENEFAGHVVRFVCGLNDGHAFAAAPAYRMHHRTLPLRVAEVREGIVVTDVVNDATVAGEGPDALRGDLLRSVDGQDIETIISDRANFVSASTGAARRLKSVRESVLLRDRKAVVMLEGPDGTKKQVNLQTLYRDDPRLKDPPEENWNLRIQDNVAILRIRRFSIEDWNEWKQTAVADRDKVLAGTYETITGRFRELHELQKKPLALVIDVRGNGGGTDLIGIHVARHLMPDRFRYFLLSSLYPNGTWSPFGGISYEPIADPTARWSGPLFLLVDEDCFSTTDNFLRCLVDLRKDTVVIGRPTAGGTGAPRKIVQLSHSRISVYGCTQRVQGPKGTLIEGRGTIPDHLVERTRQDIIDGRDPELEMALQLSNAKDD